MAKIPIVMPKMGESITEATITTWLKQPGDAVAKDEVVLEIATDKVDSEIAAPADGVLTAVLFAEDDVVAVGTTIAEIETDAEAAVSALASPPVPKEATPDATPELAAPEIATIEAPTPAVASSGGNGAAVAPAVATAPAVPAPVVAVATLGKVPPRLEGAKRFYSPLVRSIAHVEGVTLAELERIPGSGLKGRVTKHDMLGYLGQRAAAGPPAVSPAVSPTAPAAPVPAPAAAEAPATAHGFDPFKPYPIAYDPARVEIVKMSPQRRAIAEHMVRSSHISPHVTSIAEADLTRVVEFREARKSAFAERHGFKLTYTAFIAYATVKALAEFPMVNSSLDGRNIIVHKQVHLGIATSIGDGTNLIVPVVRDAGALNFVGIAAGIHDLATRARDKKLSPDEATGGTFTITNNGNFGVSMGLPIINQPQTAILGLGGIRKMPWVVTDDSGTDTIAVRHICILSLAYDHRVIDGMTGGLCLAAIARHLEEMDFDTLGIE